MRDGSSGCGTAAGVASCWLVLVAQPVRTKAAKATAAATAGDPSAEFPMLPSPNSYLRPQSGAETPSLRTDPSTLTAQSLAAARLTRPQSQTVEPGPPPGPLSATTSQNRAGARRM